MSDLPSPSSDLPPSPVSDLPPSPVSDLPPSPAASARDTAREASDSARDAARRVSTTARTTARDAARRVSGVVRLDERSAKVQRRVTVVFTIAPLVGVVLAVIHLWGWGVTATDLGIAAGFYFATGFGVTVGYHRLFTHRSFEVPRPVRWVIAILGSMAVQGSILEWCATHRRHHAHSDEHGDPHSPHLSSRPGVPGALAGLWHAHIGWMAGPDRTLAERWAPDLVADRVVARVDRWFTPLTIASFVMPALIGLLVTQSLWGAVTAFIWGSLVRVFLLHHVTWSINSICHFYGTRPFESHDESRNNPVMAVLGFGEGWHNTHHAFPASARHGLKWWQLDTSWIVIRTLSVVRLARNVKLPSPTQRTRKVRAPA